MRVHHLLLACAASLALVAAAAAPARAQSQAEIQLARQTAGEGLMAYKAGEYKKALALFQQARAVYPSAQILRMLGYSHLALDQWPQTVEALEAALDSKVGPLDDADRKDVQEQLAKALAHFGTITVTSKADGTELVVDDKSPEKLPLEKPLRLLEGKHKLVTRAEGRLDRTVDVDVEGGKALELDVTPPEKAKPAPPPPPPPPPPPAPARKAWIPHQREVGVAAAGTGVALAAAALVTSLEGAHIRGNVSNDVAIHQRFYPSGCSGGNARLCQYDVAVINHEADQADALRTWSVALVVPAAVLAGGGAVLYFMAPKPAKPADEAPRAGLRASCGVAGAGLACAGTF